MEEIEKCFVEMEDETSQTVCQTLEETTPFISEKQLETNLFNESISYTIIMEGSCNDDSITTGIISNTFTNSTETSSELRDTGYSDTTATNGSRERALPLSELECKEVKGLHGLRGSHGSLWINHPRLDWMDTVLFMVWIQKIMRGGVWYPMFNLSFLKTLALSALSQITYILSHLGRKWGHSGVPMIGIVAYGMILISLSRTEAYSLTEEFDNMSMSMISKDRLQCGELEYRALENAMIKMQEEMFAITETIWANHCERVKQHCIEEEIRNKFWGQLKIIHNSWIIATGLTCVWNTYCAARATGPSATLTFLNIAYCVVSGVLLLLASSMACGHYLFFK